MWWLYLREFDMKKLFERPYHLHFGHRTDADHEHGDADLNRYATVAGTHSFVVAAGEEVVQYFAYVSAQLFRTVMIEFWDYDQIFIVNNWFD